jgi:cysteine sulfinate desulfinase/cysteine desulfurase-like protein
MGCPPEVVQGGLRLSLGATTTLEEVDEAARRILQVVKQLRHFKSGGGGGLPPREADSKAL